MSQRINWLDSDTNLPALDERVQKLEHFMKSMEDGIIDNDELSTQGKTVASAMEAVQGSLSDEQHAKVTTLLVELMAYSVMSTIHGLVPSPQPETPTE